MQNSNLIQILVLDDEKSIRRLIEKELCSDNREITTAATAAQAFKIIKKKTFDVIILDIRLPDGNGLELMEDFQEIMPGAEVILITGHGDIDSAVKAMKQSAYDYITKPFELDRLDLVIEKAFQRVCLQRENRALRHNHEQKVSARLIGKSEAVTHVRYLIGKVAPTHVPVLMTGQSGTGKNVVSHLIHSQSLRSNQPLITKNCGTLQKELIRSELFGHAKGAFTGANDAREGLLALAHKGTLFLDEVGELPPEVQASLLRVLETQSYRRVGDSDERQTDIRFIFATNRNLIDEVKAGRFSEALFHRLNVFNIELPPLKERKQDLPLLIEYFREKLSMSQECRISQKALECLLSYDWPGNIRELQNVIERGIILAENGLITEQTLPRELAEAGNQNPGQTPFYSLEQMEKNHIIQILKYTEGNRVKTAKILGIGRKTLYRKIKKYDIEQAG